MFGGVLHMSTWSTFWPLHSALIGTNTYNTECAHRDCLVRTAAAVRLVVRTVIYILWCFWCR